MTSFLTDDKTLALGIALMSMYPYIRDRNLQCSNCPINYGLNINSIINIATDLPISMVILNNWYYILTGTAICGALLS